MCASVLCYDFASYAPPPPRNCETGRCVCITGKSRVLFHYGAKHRMNLSPNPKTASCAFPLSTLLRSNLKHRDNQLHTHIQRNTHTIRALFEVTKLKCHLHYIQMIQLLHGLRLVKDRNCLIPAKHTHILPLYVLPRRSRSQCWELAASRPLVSTVFFVT